MFVIERETQWGRNERRFLETLSVVILVALSAFASDNAADNNNVVNIYSVCPLRHRALTPAGVGGPLSKWHMAEQHQKTDFVIVLVIL